jgi:hypothetical protein
METVSLNLIEDIWNRLCDLDEKASAQLSKEFFKAQPALGIYCAAQNENLGKDGESSPMVELTIAIWQAMTQMAGRPIPMATPEEIEAAEEAITKRLEKLQEDSEMELQTHARGTIRNHNQREMLGFGVEILMQRYQEDPDLAPDSLGLEMLWLNTVVDCLDNLDPNVPRPQLEIPDLPDWPEPVPLGSEPAESDLQKSEPSKPVVSEPKIGRNDPCPCGSGKKYKKCCHGKSV